eukprot:4539360-Alexandrium_andersonii.AAC.1
MGSVVWGPDTFEEIEKFYTDWLHHVWRATSLDAHMREELLYTQMSKSVLLQANVAVWRIAAPELR